MIVNGPVSMTVRFESSVDATNKISYQTEFVVADEEEASAKGSQFFALVKAFNVGMEES